MLTLVLGLFVFLDQKLFKVLLTAKGGPEIGLLKRPSLVETFCFLSSVLLSNLTQKQTFSGSAIFLAVQDCYRIFDALLERKT